MILPGFILFTRNLSKELKVVYGGARQEPNAEKAQPDGQDRFARAVLNISLCRLRHTVVVVDCGEHAGDEQECPECGLKHPDTALSLCDECKATSKEEKDRGEKTPDCITERVLEPARRERADHPRRDDESRQHREEQVLGGNG